MKLGLTALLLILLSLYVFIFPLRLKNEIIIEPAFALDLYGPTEMEQLDPGIPFRAGNRFGYISPEGNILFLDRTLYDVTLSSEYFINYSRVAGNLVIQTADGEFFASVDHRGYPLFLEDRLFLFSTNRSSISELDTQGEVLWRREYVSIITAVDVQNDLLVVGLLDGRCQVLDRDGSLLNDLPLRVSRIAAVYGCALSSDGTLVAVIHGIDEQILSLFQIDGADNEFLASKNIKDQFRRRRHLFFTEDSTHIALAAELSVLLVSVSDFSEIVVPLSGSFVGMTELVETKVLVAAAKNQKGTEIVWTTSGGLDIGRFQLSAGAAIIGGVQNRIFFSGDDGILSMRASYR